MTFYPYTRLNEEVPNQCHQDQRFPSHTMKSERQSLMFLSGKGLQSSNTRQSPCCIEMKGKDSSLGVYKSICSLGPVAYTNRPLFNQQ